MGPIGFFIPTQISGYSNSGVMTISKTFRGDGKLHSKFCIKIINY